ncbi:MAG: hypothetical protein U0992_18375 [Planctomycetaceae bacterium]
MALAIRSLDKGEVEDVVVLEPVLSPPDERRPVPLGIPPPCGAVPPPGALAALVPPPDPIPPPRAPANRSSGRAHVTARADKHIQQNVRDR